MKVYILCPDGKNRPEMFIPDRGYLYFGLYGPTLYNSSSTRRGIHPIEHYNIKESSQYKAIELDETGEAAISGIINKIRERRVMKRGKERFEKDRRDSLKSYDDKIKNFENLLEELKTRFDDSMTTLREITQTS